MCDRSIPQQNLCADLADLIYILPRDTVVPWLRGFWATMSREWTGIDVLRMEKFLLLVRRVIGALFRWMKMSGETEGSWDAGRVDDVLALLREWPFALEDQARPETGSGWEPGALVPETIPVGLKLHALDVWADEAEKVGLLERGDEEASKIVQRISDLVDALERGTISPAVRIRSKDSLADPRLPGNKIQTGAAKGTQGNTEMADGNADDAGSWDGFDDSD
jgi:ribosomal RNA-processing protein 1